MSPEPTSEDEVRPSAPFGGASANHSHSVEIARPLMIGASLTVCNRAFLAPLSGISDVPFRRLARRFGAGLVFSEMIASGELVRGNDESRMRSLPDGLGIHAVQLAGRDPKWMKAASRKLVMDGVDLIDINMGCPAKKVVGGMSGSALMREPDLAQRIIEATLEGAEGKVPVSLKLRLGWDRSSLNAGDIAAAAEAAGVSMITVHGRTRSDFYEGVADWHAIREVRKHISVPLIANGDLVDVSQVSPMLRASDADAVMAGRGAQGRPWLFGLLAGSINRDDLSRVELADLVCEHLCGMIEHYGLSRGLRHSRKHLGWYMDRFAALAGPLSSTDRFSVMRDDDIGRLRRRLGEIFSAVSLAEIEPSFADHRIQKAA